MKFKETLPPLTIKDLEKMIEMYGFKIDAVEFFNCANRYAYNHDIQIDTDFKEEIK
jgi:hypothetical protein